MLYMAMNIINPLSLVIILGPTAVGKSAIAIEIAERIGAEIISADSRQIYVGMDIGTAKPTADELSRVRHHLIDICLPDQTMTVAEYHTRAMQATDEIDRRGKLPLLVGGTGQYIRAITKGWSIPEVPPRPELRSELETFAALYGPAALHERLAALNPASASSIDFRNVRRVVRAIEVAVAFPDVQPSRWAKFGPRILQIGLTMPRKSLYMRVDRRIDQMVSARLLEEVEYLVNSGYSWELPSMSALGYAQFRPYFEGMASLDEVVASIRRDTRSFVRRQYNWFRLSDPAINWFDVETSTAQKIEAFISAWLSGE